MEDPVDRLEEYRLTTNFGKTMLYVAKSGNHARRLAESDGYCIVYVERWEVDCWRCIWCKGGN